MRSPARPSTARLAPETSVRVASGATSAATAAVKPVPSIDVGRPARSITSRRRGYERGSGWLPASPKRTAFAPAWKRLTASSRCMMSAIVATAGAYGHAKRAGDRFILGPVGQQGDDALLHRAVHDVGVGLCRHGRRGRMRPGDVGETAERTDDSRLSDHGDRTAIRRQQRGDPIDGEHGLVGSAASADLRAGLRGEPSELACAGGRRPPAEQHPRPAATGRSRGDALGQLVRPQPSATVGRVDQGDFGSGPGEDGVDRVPR